MSFLRRGGLCLAFVMICTVGLRAQTTGNGATDETKTYADSAEGIEQQFADVLAVVRTGDDGAIQKAMEILRLPDVKGWMNKEFDAEDAGAQEELYLAANGRWSKHVLWVTGTFGKNPEFALKVEESQVPGPLSDVGFEGLIPRPKETLKVENFRFSSNITDPQNGSPSWVSSFVYIGGRFRMIGGTLPYWAEGASMARGPMQLPAKEMNGRTVQAAANRDDKVGRGLDGIVHIKVNLDQDGKLERIEVLSGEPEFIADAMEYLREAEFPKGPAGLMGLVVMSPQGGGTTVQSPTFAPSAPPKNEWDMEVAFFTPKAAAVQQ